MLPAARRDLKPQVSCSERAAHNVLLRMCCSRCAAQNVLLFEDESQQLRAKVADFGIARFKDSSCASTKTGLAGTPQYMVRRVLSAAAAGPGPCQYLTCWCPAGPGAV